MKKYTSEYFEKKYRILFDKLIQKDDFEIEIINERKKLGIPENGFLNHKELAKYIYDNLEKEERFQIAFMTFFFDEYLKKNNMTISNSDEDKEKFDNGFLEFMKITKKGKNIDSLAIIQNILEMSENHEKLFFVLLDNSFMRNKKMGKISKVISHLIQKYFGIELLDPYISSQFIEKYFLMGRNGVDFFIRKKVLCKNCRYIGVEYFSPIRADMEGQEEGPYSNNYIFNENTIRRLSIHFNSVFLIIKPYATKELVIQYIEDNWESLKDHMIEKNTFYKQFDVHPSIIKESDNEKNRLVYELNKLSKRDLLKKYKGSKDFTFTGIYKESIISAILEEEHNIKMSPDAIKKTATRFSKKIKTQIIPKDIGDI